MYQAHYTADGTIKGFYIVGLHPNIPTPTLEITTEQHADYFARGQNHRVIEGVWMYVEPEEPTPEEQQAAKLQEIDTWTAQHITGGFVSSALGASHTYDSEQVDQDNIKLMHAASMSPSFETDPTYQGHVPIRAIPVGQTVKVVLMHNKTQLQALIDDMARHIGSCKQIGWQLQATVAAATTKEELNVIVWPE